jgi:hypothetical protein
MLYITFRIPMRNDDRLCGPANELVLSCGGIACSSPPQRIATLQNGMWWVDGDPFTTAEVHGAVRVTLLGGATIGPLSGVRVISEYIYDTDKLIARRHKDKWLANGRRHDRIHRGGRVGLRPDGYLGPPRR